MNLPLSFTPRLSSPLSPYSLPHFFPCSSSPSLPTSATLPSSSSSPLSLLPIFLVSYSLSNYFPYFSSRPLIFTHLIALSHVFLLPLFSVFPFSHVSLTWICSYERSSSSRFPHSSSRTLFSPLSSHLHSWHFPLLFFTVPFTLFPLHFLTHLPLLFPFHFLSPLSFLSSFSPFSSPLHSFPYILSHPLSYS